MTPNTFPLRSLECDFTLPDPGASGVISPQSGFSNVRLNSAGSETRTCPDPTRSGIEMTLNAVSLSGNIAITFASAFDEAGDTVLTFTANGQIAKFRSVEQGTGSFVWRLLSADGPTGPTAQLGTISVAAITAMDSSLDVTGLAAAQGGAVALTGGASSTSANNGGAVTLVGGVAGATGNGGAVTITGGVGGATSGSGGAVNLTSGAAGATTGVAGAIAIVPGSSTSGNGPSVTITGGAGAGGTNAGGDVNLVGGAAVSTGNPGEVKINGTSGFFEASWFQPLTTTGCPASGSVVNFFQANRAYRVKAIRVRESTVGTSETFTFHKNPSGTAAGAGTALLTGAITLGGTSNNVPVAGTLSSTVATVTLAAGDSLSFTVGGTVGVAAGVVVGVLLEPC